MSGRVYVAGTGMTRFGKQPDRTLKSLTAEATQAALEAARLTTSDLEAAYFANAVAGSITGQEMVAGQVALSAAGITRIPVFNIENACASASSAFHLAWQSISSGATEVVLAVGAEKLSHPDKERTFRAIGGAVDVEEVDMSSATGRSPFMDLYAQEARHYMETSGATERDFAAVAVKNQANGSLNPNAQYGGALSVEDVLAAREICWPLTLYMCSPVGDGAAASILVSERVARQIGARVRVAATAVASVALGPSEPTTAASLSARKAYEGAGLGPEDVSCAEVHDASAPAEIELYERLGFAGAGAGPELIRSGATAIGGRIPVNTSGGLLARGHPIGATGLAQLHEAFLQLRGEAGARQVANAKVALCENGGGWLRGDNAAAAVTILTI